jgi:hypothetical protein
VTHYASSFFWQTYDKLPLRIQNLADKNFELLKANPHHPSLHFKKIDRYYSVRVGIQYRALRVALEDSIVWFWIGDHATYDKLLGR